MSEKKADRLLTATFTRRQWAGIAMLICLQVETHRRNIHLVPGSARVKAQVQAWLSEMELLAGKIEKMLGGGADE